MHWRCSVRDTQALQNKFTFILEPSPCPIPSIFSSIDLLLTTKNNCFKKNSYEDKFKFLGWFKFMTALAFIVINIYNPYLSHNFLVGFVILFHYLFYFTLLRRKNASLEQLQVQKDSLV